MTVQKEPSLIHNINANLVISLVKHVLEQQITNV